MKHLKVNKKNKKNKTNLLKCKLLSYIQASENVLENSCPEYGLEYNCSEEQNCSGGKKKDNLQNDELADRYIDNIKNNDDFHFNDRDSKKEIEYFENYNILENSCDDEAIENVNNDNNESFEEKSSDKIEKSADLIENDSEEDQYLDEAIHENPQKRRPRKRKIIKIVKKDVDDIETVDFGVDIFYKYKLNDIYRKNENPNINIFLTQIILEDYPDKSMAGINEYECTFTIEGKMLDDINEYINKGDGFKEECISYFYKFMYRQFNNICILKFVGNVNEKHYSKYARCSHFTCRKYKFVATGDLSSSIKVDVFVKPGFDDPTNPNKNIVIHPYNIALAEPSRGLARKLIQNDFERNQKSHKYLEENLPKVSIPLWNHGRRNDLSSDQVRQMIYEKNKFIRKSDDDFQDASLYVNNNDDVIFIQNPLFSMISSVEQIQTFSDNCTTIHFDATGSICRDVPEAKKRIYLYSFVGYYEFTKCILPVACFIQSQHSSYDIEEMFFKLKMFCNSSKLKFPFFDRICIDQCKAMLLAIIRFFSNNRFKNVIEFYNFIFEKLKTNPKSLQEIGGIQVIPQHCRFHTAKIMVNDADELFKNHPEHVLRIFSNALKASIKIEHFDTAIEFFKSLLFVFASKQKSEILDFLKLFEKFYCSFQTS